MTEGTLTHSDGPTVLLGVQGCAGQIAVSADFERGGLSRAAGLLSAVPAAVPCRLSSRDYLAAVVSDGGSGPALGTSQVTTAWDPRLGPPLANKRIRVTEEDRFDILSRRLELPWIGVDGLRHSYATLLLQAGVHPKVVQERLGHSSIAVTLDVYSHVIPSLQGEARGPRRGAARRLGRARSRRSRRPPQRRR